MVKEVNKEIENVVDQIKEKFGEGVIMTLLNGHLSKPFFLT